MTEELSQPPTLKEFLAEIRLYTTHPHLAAALEAVESNGTKKIQVQIDGIKLYSIITPTKSE